MENELKWFHYSQNNSGGYFIENDEVSEDLFVQAEDANQANKKAFEVTEDYSKYCECCGERWWISAGDKDGCEVPTIYETKITEKYKPFKIDTYATLHYADGRVVKFYSGDNLK